MSRSIAAAEMFGAEDRIFTETRIQLYAVSMAVAIVAVSAWEFLHGRSVIDPAGKPVCIDFCTIWVSGNFGDPMRVYDYPVLSAAQASWSDRIGLIFRPTIIGIRQHSFSSSIRLA